MGEGPGSLGEKLGLLPLIRKYEDEVEGDFAFYYPHTDYRDRFLPGGGASRLTLRRLLVLVDRLPPESSFKSACEGRVPVSEISAAVGDMVHAFSGKPWPRWTQLEKQREQQERSILIERKRIEARKFNAERLKKLPR